MQNKLSERKASPSEKWIEDLIKSGVCYSQDKIYIDLKNSRIIEEEAMTTKVLESLINDHGTSNSSDNNLSLHFCKNYSKNSKFYKVYECSICSKDFQKPSHLIRHLSSHATDRKYVCEECGKAFRQQSTLTQHRAIHSTDRPFSCEDCSKTFNRSSSLISHRKTHSEKKTFKCHICEIAFHQKGNLKNHINTHTKQQPYKCIYCEKGFNQKSNLTCHMQKIHPDLCGLPWKCDRCPTDFKKRAELRIHEIEIHNIRTTLTKKSNKNKKMDLSSPKTTNKNQRPDNQYKNNTDKLKNYGLCIPKINTGAMKYCIKQNKTPFGVLQLMDNTTNLVKISNNNYDQSILTYIDFDFCLKTLDKHKKSNTTLPPLPLKPGDIFIFEGFELNIVAIIYETLNEKGQTTFEIISPDNVSKCGDTRSEALISNIKTNIDGILNDMKMQTIKKHVSKENFNHIQNSLQECNKSKSILKNNSTSNEFNANNKPKIEIDSYNKAFNFLKKKKK